MPNNEEEQDSGYRKPKWKKQTQRQQMDRRLESAGLLNYQTEGLSQAEIAARYKAANININSGSNWWKDNYKGNSDNQYSQPTGGSNWSEGQANPEAPAPQPINVGRASKGWDPAKTNKYFYQTDPNTGLATKMRATSADSKQVQAGQANWTDVFVAERKRILSDPLFYQTNQITKYPEYARQQMLADPAFQWDKLPKLKIAGVDTKVNWQKLYYEASSSPVAMGAVQGLIMGMGNPGGAIAGAAIGATAAATGYDQNKEAWQQGDGKWTWNVEQLLKEPGRAAFGYMNMLAEWAEKTIGTTAMVANAAADPNKEVADVLNRDTWNASASFFEVFAPAIQAAQQGDGKLTIGDTAKLVPALWQAGVIADIVLNPEKFKGEELYLGAAMPVELKQTWTERLDQARAEIAKGRNYREVMTEMQTGIMAQIGDMAGQGIFDPLNVMPKVETDIVRKGAELAGNKPLAEAFTGVETPREGLEKYKTLVRTGEAAKLDPNFSAQKLSPLGKWAAGLNKRGEVKMDSLLPTNKGLLDADPKNPAGRLFEESPQSRAQAGASMFDRNVGTLLHMFSDPREAAGYLRRIASGDMTAWAEMGSALGNSPEWYTILPALKDYTGEKLTALAEAWELTATNRDALNRMAEVLGVDPTKLIDDWAARNTLAQDFETIRRKATESNTPASRAILADIASGAINTDTLKQIVDIFHGEGAIPHTEAQWKWAMYADMSDHFAEWVATHLQLDKSPEAQSAFFQTMGILKQAQSLVLLGLSPGYAITNGLSGIVHLAATGVYGSMTPKQMNDWITRWETPIPRLDEGVGIGGLVDTAKSSAISDAVRPEAGPLSTIKQTLSKLQRGMPMSKLSSKFESVNSKRGYVTGIRQFWSRSWRRGVGFRKMEPALVAILKEAGINPDHIYAAYEAGVNQGDIERALTGQYRGMQASALVEEAARQAGVTPAEAADMLTKSGVTDLLDTYLKSADTPDKIDAAFKRADDHMQRWIDIKYGEELATRAEEVRAIVSKEGIAAGLKIAQQNSDLFYKAWFDHYERFGDIMAGIDGLDGRMADIAIEEAYRQSDINFRRVFANMANNYKAIFDVWGLSGNADAAAAMHAISDMNNSMKSAYDFMRKTMREMKSKAAAEGRRPTGQEWSDAQSKIDKAFEQGFKEKRQAYFRMGEALGKVYTQLHGKNAGEAARAWWNDISKFTEKIEADEKRFREEIKAARDMGADPADIQEAKRKYYSENKRLFMSDLQKINDDGIARLERIIKNKGGDATPTPAPIEPTPPSDAGPTAAPAKKLTKAQEKAAKMQEEINALIADNEKVDAQERATRAQQASVVWDIAEGYWGKGGNYSRGISNDKFALLNALKNPAYQGIPDLLGLWDARLTPEKVTEILDNRKAIKEAEKAVATPPSIKEIKKRKAKAPEDINILDAIRGYGGLNIAKITDYANDKRVGSLFGLFTKQKYGKGWDITDMARYLAGDKYDINLDDPNDPGGVNQTQELLRRALAGEKIYPTTHDYTADTAKIDAAELAHIEALKADEAAFAAEQFNAETWKARMQEAIATKNGEAVDELFGELPDEIANTAHDADGETYAEYVLRAQNNIEADAINDARATSTATAKTDADTFVKAQEDASERATTRTLMLESWTEIFGAEQAQTYMEMSDAIAQWYERTTGQSADEFYSRYYEEVRRSAEADVIGNLEQSYRVGENIQNRTLTEQDAQNYARMLARSESEARNMIRNEPNKADRIAILRALEEINPDMAERIAQEETNTLYQLADTQTIEWARKKFDATGKIVNRAWVLPDGTILEAGFSHGDKTSQMISDGAIRVWLTESSGFINKDTGKGVKTLRLELEGKLTRAQRYALEPYMTDKVIIDFTKDRYPVKGNGFIEANGIDEAMKYLRQAEGISAKGAVTFDADGIKATIHAFESADFSTLVHENAHVFRRVMKDVAERTGNKQVVADLATIEEWAGVKDGAWTRKAEEKFARGFEKYIRDGEAPTPKLKAAFETFRKWMVEIYRTIKGSDIESAYLSQEVKDVFDRMLGAEAPTEPTTPKRDSALFQRTKQEIADGSLSPAVERARKLYKETPRRDDWTEKAREQFLVKNAADYVGAGYSAAWMLPDGKIISVEDHIDIAPVVDNGMTNYAVDDFKAQTGSLRMWSLYKERVFFIDMSNSIPTDAQVKAINKIIASGEYDSVTYDISDSDANLITSGEERASRAGINKIVGKARQIFEGTSQPNTLFQSADQPIGTVEEAGQQPPHAQAMAEGYEQQVRPLMEAMRQVARERVQQPLDGATRDLSPEGQAMLKKYTQQVKADMAGTKNAATKWGESQRDFAMLNYNKRYGIDRYIETVYPYQFFYTRSLATWAARALDKPAIFSQYARIKRQQDRYERDIPERLRGKIKIPMPWLPDWMGDALYIDPMRNLFTPLNFMRPFERMVQDNTYQQIEAERILQEWEADQSVPSSDIATARNTREGATWERAFAEAQIRRESEINTPFDFLSTMFGPAWYLTTPLKLAGVTTFPGAEGGKETISSTPILNTTRALDTVTQGTWAEPFGDIIGLLGKPEEMLRNKLGLPEFGEYGEYYVDRQLTNMVIEGLITSDEAQIAMIEREGKTFDQARERVKMELAVRVPTAAALLASLNADNFINGIGRLVATLPPSLFGSGLLPAGEIEYRGLKQEWNEMWKMVDAGDKKATGKFFDEHPEYEAYLAKNKKPEERMKSFLVSQVWDGYNALGKTDKKSFMEAAPNFERDFLEEETRAPLNVDVETLAQWAQMLSQSIPNTPATAVAIENPIAKPEYFDPAITKVTDRYFTDRTKLFPNYFVEQNGYFEIPKSDKSAKYKYLKEHPNLKKYWDWNDAYAKKYPDLVPIFKNQVFKQIDTSAWPPALLDYVTIYAYTGEKLPKGAYKALKQVWLAEGQPMGDMDSWLASEVAPALLYGAQP